MPTNETDLPLNEETLRARRAEKERLVSNLRARTADAPVYTAVAEVKDADEPESVADTLASMDEQKRAADAAVVTDALAPYQAAVEAMAREGAAAIKRMERLRDRHLVRLSTLANLDIRNLLKVIPVVVTAVNKAAGATVTNHFHLVTCVNAARDLFDRANRWKPIDYLDQLAASRGTLAEASNPLLRTSAGDIVNAKTHLRHHLDALLRMVDAFARDLARLAVFEARVADDLAKFASVPKVVGEEPAKRLPALQPTPGGATPPSSYQDWDPFTGERPTAPGGPKIVERVGASGEGIRVRVPLQPESKTAKLI